MSRLPYGGSAPPQEDVEFDDIVNPFNEALRQIHCNKDLNEMQKKAIFLAGLKALNDGVENALSEKESPIENNRTDEGSDVLAADDETVIIQTLLETFIKLNLDDELKKALIARVKNSFKPYQNNNSKDDTTSILLQEQPHQNQLLSATSMQVIGLFTAAIGTAAVALGIVLNLCSVGVAGNISLCAGIGLMGLGIGLFAANLRSGPATATGDEITASPSL